MVQRESKWYLFKKPSQLERLLQNSSQENLLSPYQLWRYEQSGDGQTYLLLSVEGPPLPPDPEFLEIIPQSQYYQHNLRYGSDAMVESPSRSDLPASSLRISFMARDEDNIPTLYSGLAFLIRQGRHLLASIGLEEVPPNTKYEYVLLHLPTEYLQELINQYLMVNDYPFKCSPPKDGMSWLWLHKPELFIVLKWIKEKNVEVFQSFAEAPQVMTPWKFRSSLAPKLQFGQRDLLLALDLEGDSQWLETSNWWNSQQLITLSPELRIQTINPPPAPPKIQIAPKLLESPEHQKPPELWLLRGASALQNLENLFLLLPAQQRQHLQVFAGSTPEGQLFIIRDQRPDQSAPLFDFHQAIPLIHYIDQLSIFIQRGLRFSPSLPHNVWEKIFPNTNQFSYIIISSNGNPETPEVYKLPKVGWRPLEEFADFKLNLHLNEVQALLTTNLFELLFSPTSIPTNPQIATNPEYTPPISLPNVASVPNSPSTSQSPAPPSNSPAPTQQPAESRPQHHQREHPSPSENSENKDFSEVEVVHPMQKKPKNPLLIQLEKTIAKKNLRGNSISPQEWTSLASLYRQEYNKNKDIYWLQEAISALDQVFYLDRHSIKAVELEQEILTELLKLSDEPFESKMRKLEEFISGQSPFLARLAFRYRARLFFDADLNQGQIQSLRQYFYRDLSRLEPILQIREHFIYVGGVAQFLGDSELYERSRWRYRQRIQNSALILQELPQVLKVNRRLP